MPTPTVTEAQCRDAISAVEQALREGYHIDGLPSAWERAGKTLGLSGRAIKKRTERGLELYGLIISQPQTTQAADVHASGETGPADKIRGILNRNARTAAQLMEETDASLGAVLDGIQALVDQGVNIHRRGEMFEVLKNVQPAFQARETLRYVSRPDNTFVCGASGDQHIGSKYFRADVLDDLYDRFAAAGVDRVFNTGNWIDGDARFNRFDVEAHGLEAQCRLLTEKFPQRDGIDTYAVWGDDHEGWYAQREGVDVGRYTESVMRQAGREDWHDIGFMEAHIELVNANTGATAIMAVVHPGGGSAYALSYSIQKIVESYEGGEKPHIGLYGHYHKLWSGLIRNVWVLQTGCTQDQTTFMRKKRLEAHVGGCVVRMEQDPASGAIIGFEPRMYRYFNREWYTKDGRANGRWSYTGKVRPIPRSVGAIR
jgi:biotin operon repressor